MEANGVWKEQFKIKAYMVNQNRKLSLPMMCNLFQEVAGNHANYRQLGFFEMQAANRYWVLNKIKIQVKEYPEWLDQVEAHTWVSMMRGPFSNRHFALFKNGVEVASAFSFWVAIDADSHRPVRINSDQVLILSDVEASCGPAEKLSPFEAGKELGKYKVQNSDIDMLGHVNNVKYTEWLLNQNGINQNPSSLQINYIQEAHLEDEVIIYQMQNDPQMLAIRKKSSQEVITMFKLSNTI